MTQPRLSTVYDFSDLRLHPDGTRVYQKPTNLRPDLVNATTQNSRFDWIANDAGGSATVPEFRKKVKATAEGITDGEDFLQPEEVEGPEGRRDSSEEDISRIGKKRKPKRIDNRKPKRLKFAKDYSYLDSEAPPIFDRAAEVSEVQNVAISLPEPSADLLKCIHKFASEFYTGRGQLLNISREYRKERKKRALLRRARRENRASKNDAHSDSVSFSESESEGSESGASQQRGETNSNVDESGGEDESDVNVEDVQEGSRTEKGKGKGKAKVTQPWKRKGRRRAHKLYRDMYKMFDGSAMMALGMLVQEHIAYMLNPDMPEGWEDEMKKYYGDSGQDDRPEEQMTGATATADQTAPSTEDPRSIAQNQDTFVRIAAVGEQSHAVAGSRTLRNKPSNLAHRSDDTAQLPQPEAAASATDPKVGSGLEHDTNNEDHIQPWSDESESESNEDFDSQGDNDWLSWERPR